MSVKTKRYGDVPMNDFELWTANGKITGGVHLPSGRQFDASGIREAANARGEMLTYLSRVL